MRAEAGKRADGGARFWLKLLAPALGSIIGLVALRLLGPDIVSQQRLSGWLRPLGEWAPIAFIFFLAIRPVTLLPGQVFTAVGGILFGTLMGSVYAMVGSLLATGLIILLSKRFGKRLMKRAAGEKYKALKITAQKNDFKFAVLATINPLFPTDVAIALGASSGARLWPTIAGVLVGTLPGTFLTAQFGSALSQGKTVMTAVSAVGMVASLVLGVYFGHRAVKDFHRADEAVQKEEHATPPSPERYLIAGGANR